MIDSRVRENPKNISNEFIPTSNQTRATYRNWAFFIHAAEWPLEAIKTVYFYTRILIIVT